MIIHMKARGINIKTSQNIILNFLLYIKQATAKPMQFGKGLVYIQYVKQDTASIAFLFVK